MSSDDLLIDELRLFEELCRIEWLRAGFKRVRKNKGSPGIDGVTIAAFESRLDEELSQLQQELESWTYKPSAVRRVEIPKPGGKGIRLLVKTGVKSKPGSKPGSSLTLQNRGQVSHCTYIGFVLNLQNISLTQILRGQTFKD